VATRKKSSSAIERYAPAQRLHQLKAILGSSSGVSVYDIAERFGVSVRTAIRYLRALESAGEPLHEITDGKKKLWRLHPAARKETIALTTQQAVTLFLTRRVFDFLDGTGFAESLDEIFAKLEATLLLRERLAELDAHDSEVREAEEAHAQSTEGRVPVAGRATSSAVSTTRAESPATR